ncbi:LysM peptidoglycan-binding domain-containing protein [Paradesulfitobacterium ferrireducens]|uniref:LysM peptidoglycan-binding domain-containing protein n=1 Tax=Paradesulfitobacterium ferrireducens TaxID=2816476 RepID=UPI001A8E6438|nr:LysM domain-containing protein [Paradesulfitobacterium ferrireducens]
MKKTLGLVLSVSLVLTAMVSPSFAVDTSTSASVEAPAPTTPTTPKAPAPKAPSAPSAVNAGLDTTKLPEGTVVYTVVSGDVFWKIAKKYSLTTAELAKLNPHIKNVNRIYPGDKLIVKAAPVTAPAVSAKKLFHGFGEVPNYRIRGEKKDNLNITTASALFDQDGKIVDLTWDVMEITYDLFPGWVDPKADKATMDSFAAKIDDIWETKREEGYNYDMTHLKAKGAADNLTKKEWFEQLDFYEAFFKGKTVSEVEAWFKKYTDVNGRPYKMAYPDKLTDADKAVVKTFTAEEKAMLVDVTTGATMSLQDPHSHFISALKEAYEAREEVKY